MLRYSFIILLLVSPEFLKASDSLPFRFIVDLIDVKNDQVKVEAIAPPISENTVNFCIPKIVPGTYSIYDFGRFIEDFHAFDKIGSELRVSNKDVNTWEISDATNLHRITYRVNDSFDAFDMDTAIFEPAGSNIQIDSNYLLNTFAFIGYIQGKELTPYELKVKHRPDFFGGTSLVDHDAASSSDLFKLRNYHEVTDAPIMYCVPDTATVMVGNCRVLITVYSPAKKVSAHFLAGKMDTLLQASGKYLGGRLPVDHYAFIIYLTGKAGISGGSGALEHSNSSVYYMPEFDNETFGYIFPDIAAHEFFHILTPLTIHSEEIQYFDYNNPRMSEHLWLYEGTTEYHAHLSQVKYKLISNEDFLERMREKITTSQQNFNDTLPFTMMSKKVLEEHKGEFVNVYQKGALIGMCLDIKLRSLSNGKYGLQNLISDLGKMYGSDRPFKDNELFDVIGKLTYPEITAFLNQYVAGTKPLPYEEIFKIVGIKYTPIQKDMRYTLGRLSIAMNPATRRNVIYNTGEMNEFGKTLGFRDGDEIVSINKQKLTVDNFIQFRDQWFATVKDGDPFKVVVLRMNEEGKQKKVKLRTKVFKAESIDYNLLLPDPNATAEEVRIRETWLNP